MHCYDTPPTHVQASRHQRSLAAERLVLLCCSAQAADAGRSGLQAGAYVRAYGTIRTFNNMKNMQAYSIRPITNFNEVRN